MLALNGQGYICVQAACGIFCAVETRNLLPINYVDIYYRSMYSITTATCALSSMMHPVFGPRHMLRKTSLEGVEIYGSDLELVVRHVRVLYSLAAGAPVVGNMYTAVCMEEDVRLLQL
mgnify:CR=1 FL=1